jgi:hypothetical protein
MVISKNTNTSYGKYKIVDAPRLLWGVGCLIIFTWCGFANLISGEHPAILTLLCFVLVGGAILYLRANWKGIILESATDTMEFPGGGIAANDISDYLNPKWLLQFFRRTKIQISDIREISRENEKHVKFNNSNNLKTNYIYYLNFNGAFGSVKLRLYSESKRDELFSKIREINKMGSPIIKE